MQPLTDFFLQLDHLKQVERRTYVGAGQRLENSAEHSWHLAMACWCMARHLQLPVSEERLIKLALLHDLGEIDAGDTFLYAPERADAHQAERQCIRRLAEHPGNPLDEFEALWEEQESGDSPEARLLKAVDRLLPFLLNIASQGRAWQESAVRRSQVEAAQTFIDEDFPRLHQWLQGQIEAATRQGWLQDS